MGGERGGRGGGVEEGAGLEIQGCLEQVGSKTSQLVVRDILKWELVGVEENERGRTSFISSSISNPNRKPREIPPFAPLSQRLIISSTNSSLIGAQCSFNVEPTNEASATRSNDPLST